MCVVCTSISPNGVSASTESTHTLNGILNALGSNPNNGNFDKINCLNITAKPDAAVNYVDESENPLDVLV